MSNQEWTNGLFGCMKDIKGCLCGCLCGCYVGGLNAQKLGHADSWVVPCLLYIICRPCYAPYRRGKIREHYGIEGGFLGDCCVSLCCACCAIVQEANEIEERGTNSAAGAPTGQAVS